MERRNATTPSALYRPVVSSTPAGSPSHCSAPRSQLVAPRPVEPYCGRMREKRTKWADCITKSRSCTPRATALSILLLPLYVIVIVELWACSLCTPSLHPRLFLCFLVRHRIQIQTTDGTCTILGKTVTRHTCIIATLLAISSSTTTLNGTSLLGFYKFFLLKRVCL